MVWANSTLFYRTGGAPSLALGMAHIFARSGGGQAVIGFWYHFAIMFEALFILTIIDAGTRVGRFMLQDLLGHVHPTLGRTSWMPGVVATSGAIVLGWGYFLYQGVRDPLGGINSLWPLFGIANQLLATIALCVATTILIKMHRARYLDHCRAAGAGCFRTFTAAWQKIFAADPRLGFLSQAAALSNAIGAGKIAATRIAETHTVIFNQRLDAAVCGIFLLLVSIILIDSVRVWFGILSRSSTVVTSESPFVSSQLEMEGT